VFILHIRPKTKKPALCRGLLESLLNALASDHLIVSGDHNHAAAAYYSI
jgi:hypothetical protein